MTMEIPGTKSRGATPENVYETLFDAEEGDELTITVDAEAGHQLGLDDRVETWTCEITGVGYDSRKNIYGITVNSEADYGESGKGKITFHPRKNPDKGLTFGSNSMGSRVTFSAPVDIFEDDRDRTVVGVEQ